MNNDSKKVIGTPGKNGSSIFYETPHDEIYFFDGNEDSKYSALRKRRRTVTSANNNQREFDLRRSRPEESCYSGISHSENSEESMADDGVRNVTRVRRMRLGIVHGTSGNIRVEVNQENYNLEDHELFSGIFYLTQEQLDSFNMYYFKFSLFIFLKNFLIFFRFEIAGSEENELNNAQSEHGFISHSESIEESQNNNGADLNKLSSHQFKKGVHKSIVCSICITEFKVGDELTRLKCAHFFHKNCIVPWLKYNNNCPNCRRTATE